MLGALAVVLQMVVITGCDTPETHVALHNGYAGSSAFVIYRARWEAVSFDTPVGPAASSELHDTIPASENTAYVLIAPGWDPMRSVPPTAFIALQSTTGFAVDLDETLEIEVDDAAFVGDCSVGRALSQAAADFVTQRVFASVFQGRRYDAATCTTTAGSP